MHKVIQVLFAFLMFSLLSCREPSRDHSPVFNTDKVTNAFQSYINQSDSNYHYEFIGKTKNDDHEFHVLKLVSQSWLSQVEVQDPIWWHWVTLVVPERISSDTAFLWIGSGNRNQDPPKDADPITLATAVESQSVAIYVHNVPNQPLTFKNDAFGERYEDELISYGWRKYLNTEGEGASKWLARLPMTKAVVRAMDASSSYMAESMNRELKGFTVAGASKRGWTTWTTAVMDTRVVAIAPVVIDMLNVIPSFQHHWRAYGFWAPAVEDYEREGIMDEQNTPSYKRLVDLVEPYSYRQKLALPKLLINAAGDQFFLPDSWQFYWNDLIGEKHLRYIPNTDHSLRNSDALESLVEFHKSLIRQEDRPAYHWQILDHEIQLTTDTLQPPDSIRHWTIENPDARDFRLETRGPNWTASSIPIDPKGIYRVELGTPSVGWSAHFLELVYRKASGETQKFTSGIKVLPDSLPYPPYIPKQHE